MIQYLLLRPLLTDVPSDVLPGVSLQPSLHLSHLWHSELHQAAVSLGNLQPGDAVFLHPDILHGWDLENSDLESKTLLYLGLGPDCDLNRQYQRRLQHSLVGGSQPPDFPGQRGLSQERKDRIRLQSLNSRELRTLGWPADSVFDPALIRENICENTRLD